MNHADRLSSRGRDHVDLRIDPAQGLLKNNHAEDGGSRADVSGPRTDAVGRGHSGSRIPLGRTYRTSGSEIPGGIEQPRAFRCERSGGLSGGEDAREDFLQLPRIGFRSHKPVKDPDHARVVIAGVRVDRHNAGSVADSQHLFSGKPVVRPSGQGCQETDVLHVGLVLQNRLIQMAQAPALGHVEGEGVCQLFRRLGGHGVPPGAEGNKKIHASVKREIAVHHCADADAGELCELHAAGGFHVLFQIGVAGLESFADRVLAVGPDAVPVFVFPFVAS